MLQNYFTIGLRHMLRHKSYSLINIAGLAAGIMCCLFIVLYISDELSYDQYNERADRIYRVVMEDWAKMPPSVAPALLASYPHLAEQAVRLWPLFAPAKLRHEEVVFVENAGVFADADVFSVFSWPMVAGNPSSALVAANSIVLTESLARKYFGARDPLGRTVEFWGNDMTVTGVISDVPLNSHVRFDFLISFSTLYGVMGNDLDQNRAMPVFFTYVLAKEGAAAVDIAQAVRQLMQDDGADAQTSASVQPIGRIHLHSRLDGEFSPGGNIAYLHTLGTAALIVLLLACINFTNLTTARAVTRTKEVGVRTVMGAMRRQLIFQFFGEALMMCLAGFFIAIFLVHLGMPAFNQLSGKAVSMKEVMDPAFLLGSLAIVALIGFASGAYPALFLSRFKPAAVLKGSGNMRTSNLLVRKGLIVFQFAASTIFLVSMTVVLRQLHYLQNKDLGFDKQQVLVLDGDNFPEVRDGLQGRAGVAHVAGVPQMLGGQLPASRYRSEGREADTLDMMSHYGVTPDFIQTMGIDLIAGRTFSDNLTTDGGAFVLNESAVRDLGWLHPEEAVGRKFSMRVPPLEGGEEVWREGKIIGVVKDFHYDVLYNPIQALALYPSFDLNLTLVRLTSVSPEVIAGVKEVWNRVNPDSPFNYYFVDDHLDQKYEAEEKLGSFMGAATGLAVLIASLGLFGLVAFSAGQRTKEIGIRKVLGATVGEVVALISGDFLKLVGLSVVLAIPVAYVAMEGWLGNFTYRIGLSWIIFAAPAILVILIALFTVCYQAFMAARADAAETIRHE